MSVPNVFAILAGRIAQHLRLQPLSPRWHTVTRGAKALFPHGGKSGDTRHCYADFFFGILAPERRASLKAMATACLRLFTFLPLLDLSLPCLCSFMTLWVLRLPLEPLSELECE
jgi:hypothetical protein